MEVGVGLCRVGVVIRVRGPVGVQLVGNGSESNAVTAYYQLQKRYSSILGAYQPLVMQTKLGGTVVSGPRRHR
jgi:hypothetical protein